MVFPVNRITCPIFIFCPVWPGLFGNWSTVCPWRFLVVSDLMIVAGAEVECRVGLNSNKKYMRQWVFCVRPTRARETPGRGPFSEILLTEGICFPYYQWACLM